MTPEQFQQDLWGDSSAKAMKLPKFEKSMRAKYGIILEEETPQVIQTRERTLEKLERKRNYGGGGRKPKVTHNEFINYDLSCNSADDVIVGVVRSFEVDNTHKGNKIHKTLLLTILKTLTEISTDNIMIELPMSVAQARRYNQACSLSILHLTRTISTLTLLDEEDRY
tara:strand:- start:269 stop:772 length:504 start_codon:yes stop_codon:yes gene_type:complete